MANFEAVLFDLDNTLCFRDQDDEKIHTQVFETVGIEPFFEVEDLYAIDIDSLPTADSWEKQYEHIYRALADDPKDEEYAPALAEATIEVVDLTQVSFREGAEEAVRHAAENCKVGVVTNGREEVQTVKIEALGIRDVFEAEVYCGPGMDIAAKPDPEPFEIALQELGVEEGNALKIGDSLELDVEGAHNAGIEAAWAPVENGSDPDPEPEYVLSSMEELSTVIGE